MDTWDRLIDLRGEKGEGDWKRLAKEHICIYAKAMNTDNNVVDVRGLGGEQAGPWWMGKKGEGMVDICNSVNNKNNNNN